MDANSQQPLRDVLGGDEGKEVAATEAMGDSLEKPVKEGNKEQRNKETNEETKESQQLTANS